MVQLPRWYVIVVLAVCALGVLYAAPNLLSERQAAELARWRWLPSQQVNLGLDLRGGSHLLLEVNIKAVQAERLEAVVDTARTELRKANIGYTGLAASGDAVRVRITEPGDRSFASHALKQADPELEVEMAADGTATLRFSERALIQRRNSAVEQSIEIIRRRIDELGTREPTIQRQGEDRILVQLPGVDDPERVKELLGQTAKLTFHLLDTTIAAADALRGRVPAGSVVLPANEVGPGGARQYVVRKRVMVSGENLVDAQPTYDENSLPAVSFRFDSAGAKRFGNVTRDNVGRPLAIVLDGKVISAPVIRSPILGGNGIITGQFSVREANDLALLLRAGALPAPLTVLEERTVGPGLGADSIAAGKLASVVGMILVVVFMVLAYGLFGVMADLALVFNLALIVALLTVLQATLTLPGIAGIALTIGMAVDANVLIFERIREEQRAGRSPLSAVDAGYQRALTTIIDSNLTTLIAALLLFYFGSGPIRGFAVTLSIGILTSMFTAIMVTRLMVVAYLRRYQPLALAI
ncbi:MAG: protein translocase subunit SecD [Proteobacteria bacterium]|nr:protein translocase subunit SecD [Pseudomonadota bacterium]